MYVVRDPHYRKGDPVRRWALPDRVFFACGACHVLAQAFLERFGSDGRRAMWIRPAPGHSGHHIFVDGGGWTFDFHGYAPPGRLIAHHVARAARHCPGWDAALVEVPASVLLSGEASRAFDDALRLRAPDQFLHDPLPRARRFLDRFGPPPHT